ncbi:hypothetical protein [Achromobacter piechaudii]|uniref:hypothetical protein n=1 Tax=Achromobacter piechaudii TaxID=72556 RepID=UPI00077348E1|nr:hypothetical protein [Achromobacter piechaudii]
MRENQQPETGLFATLNRDEQAFTSDVHKSEQRGAITRLSKGWHAFFLNSARFPTLANPARHSSKA